MMALSYKSKTYIPVKLVPLKLNLYEKGRTNRQQR